MGGLGFIHYNLRLEEQVKQAQRVKQHVPGFVCAPATLPPGATVADWEALKACIRACFCQCLLSLPASR